MNNELNIMWFVRDYLEAVINEDYTVYNTVSKEYLEVNTGNINEMINMILEQLDGHGINHLRFTQEEDAKIGFTMSITDYYNETNRTTTLTEKDK